MHYRILLVATVAISVPEASLCARTQETGSSYTAPTRANADFRFESRARISLQALWRTSDAAKQERVACIGGYQHEGTTYITRVEQVSAAADSLQASAGVSLQECRRSGLGPCTRTSRASTGVRTSRSPDQTAP